MLKKLDQTNYMTAMQIMNLQKASYQIEADMIGFYEIPTLKDTMESIQKSDEIFYGYYTRETLAGLISYKVYDKVLDIHRVAVHPQFFRQGIAQKLLDYVEGLEDDLMKILVCTGKENLPAVNLYFKNGFKKIKDTQIGEGIYLTEFEKIYIPNRLVGKK